MTEEKLGRKYDAGKPRMDLMLDFGKALMAVGEVATFGAQKYAAHDWLYVPDAEERYLAALLRHLFASNVEEIDPETGLEHIAHAAWNALAILELYRRRKGGQREVQGEVEGRSENKLFGGLPDPKTFKTPDFWEKSVENRAKIDP